MSESNVVSKEQYRGYGSSISIQGGCLGVMDALMILLHHRNSVRLNNNLKNLEMRVGPGGVGLAYKF
ncbi:hypothetical protein [Dinghuibacter silviterrae]|uniref:Uncharacterized protein n=1 Tax=Dinghuibacter silviterrae TaxID=1539049 RepID=A0A4R8DPL0_9BACT|nr:hypothetical protein [Dinghuibacter silviterrae]TDW99226.1 hypothetical protein EDB95_0235 [Dinghuibacter silviterrae]